MTPLELLDNGAERILSAYRSSGLLKHTRAGLGVIALVAVCSLPFSEFGSSRDAIPVYVGLLIIGLLNVGHLVVGFYLAFRDTMLERANLKAPTYLSELGAKWKSGTTLTDREKELYLIYLKQKELDGEQLDSFEFTVRFLTSEEYSEALLFRTSDKELLSTLDRIQPHVSEATYLQVLSKVSYRLARIRDVPASSFD